MDITNVTIFCKLVTCPSAESLMRFGQLGSSLAGDEPIAQHIKVCDFCCAELKLLEYCPTAETPEEFECGDIPEGIRILAESLLFGKSHFAELVMDSSAEGESVGKAD
jgi:hypothetical protein